MPHRMRLDRVLVRVINHRSAPERRAHMTAVMAQFPHLDWGWFDGADGDVAHEFSVDQAGARRVMCRMIQPGEIGNLRSHHLLWQRLLESDKEYLLVIEDDVVIDTDFIECAARCLTLTPEPHYIKLCAHFGKPFQKLTRLSEGRWLVRYLEEPLGVQAYLLSRAGARRFIARLKRMIRPSDHFADRSWEHGLPCYGIYPPPVREDALLQSLVAKTGSRTHGTPTIIYKLCKKRDKLMRGISNIMRRMEELGGRFPQFPLCEEAASPPLNRLPEEQSDVNRVAGQV